MRARVCVRVCVCACVCVCMRVCVRVDTKSSSKGPLSSLSFVDERDSKASQSRRSFLAILAQKPHQNRPIKTKYVKIAPGRSRLPRWLLKNLLLLQLADGMAWL